MWYKLHWLPPSLQWTNYYVPRDSVSNLAFGVPSDFVLLVSAKTSYLLDQVYFLPRFARNFRIAQHILIFLSFGLIYRFASQAVARYTLILFTVISPIFISFMAFNDIVLSSIFLLTAYSALISSSKDSPHFPIIAFSALFMTFNTSFSPLFTAPAFLFLIYQKFVDYRSRDFLRLAALLGFSLPIVLYRSIFNTYDELFSGQRYQQVIANRIEDGFLGIALENYQTLSLIAIVVIFITLFSASSQEKWFKFYFWLFPINILSILIHFL
ncbi:MAG: hypothetical protein HRT44_07715 [Bdellovibrionales bacterium]|nr:hypothetical protein [Bdellovibrionales bacterium]